MINPLEELLFENIEKKKKGVDVYIGFNEALLTVTGIKTPAQLQRELHNINEFNKQFETWYRRNWGNVPKNQIQTYKAVSILNYMKSRLHEIKENSVAKQEGDMFLLNNPFGHIKDGREVLASWLSLCSRQQIKEVKLLSDGRKLRAGLVLDNHRCVINPAQNEGRKVEQKGEFIEYRKDAIVSEILTQRAWEKYSKDRYHEAMEDCSKALIITPNYINALFCRGVTKKNIGINMDQNQKGDEGSYSYFRGAMLDFKQALKKKGNFYRAHKELVGVYLKLDRVEEAEDSRKKVVSYAQEDVKKQLEKEIREIKRGSKKSILDKFLSIGLP